MSRSSEYHRQLRGFCLFKFFCSLGTLIDGPLLHRILAGDHGQLEESSQMKIIWTLIEFLVTAVSLLLTLPNRNIILSVIQRSLTSRCDCLARRKCEGTCSHVRRLRTGFPIYSCLCPEQSSTSRSSWHCLHHLMAWWYSKMKSLAVQVRMSRPSWSDSVPIAYQCIYRHNLREFPRQLNHLNCSLHTIKALYSSPI